MAQLTAQVRLNLKLLIDCEGSNRFQKQRKLVGFSGYSCGGVKLQNCVRKFRFSRVDACLGNDWNEYEFEENGELACLKGLVLDLAYRPVNVVCWKRAVCLEFMEKADVLEYYNQTVNSPRGSFNIPAVLRVPNFLQVVKRRRFRSTLNRKNILYRDSYTCQYCSSQENLTIDHVLPIARGGEWKWENLVAACARCNSRKGQKTIDEANMKLINIPKAPKDYSILAIPLTTAAIKKLRLREGTPEKWCPYLTKPYK